MNVSNYIFQCAGAASHEEPSGGEEQDFDTFWSISLSMKKNNI